MFKDLQTESSLALSLLYGLQTASDFIFLNGFWKIKDNILW